MICGYQPSGRFQGRHVDIEDVSREWATLAVQGPSSRRVLSALAPEVDGLSYFSLTPAKVAGVPVTISRTGFTGDLGFEVHAMTATWSAATLANQLARFAVPMFFVFAGYFWARHGDAPAALLAGARAMVPRLLARFATWSLIFLIPFE